LWVQGRYSRYYAETGALSPTPYLYAPEHLFIDTSLESGKERLQRFRTGLQSRPPAVIVRSSYDASMPENDPLLSSYYTQVERPDVGPVVLVRRDLVPLLTREPPTNPGRPQG
jgi:hypothetical protein